MAHNVRWSPRYWFCCSYQFKQSDRHFPNGILTYQRRLSSRKSNRWSKLNQKKNIFRPYLFYCCKIVHTKYSIVKSFNNCCDGIKFFFFNWSLLKTQINDFFFVLFCVTILILFFRWASCCYLFHLFRELCWCWIQWFCRQYFPLWMKKYFYHTNWTTNNWEISLWFAQNRIYHNHTNFDSNQKKSVQIQTKTK